MKNNKYELENKKMDLDEEIQVYLKRKKDENSALKKLLLALENAKKNSTLAYKS